MGEATTLKVVSEMFLEEGRVKRMEGKTKEKVTNYGRFDEAMSAVKPGFEEGRQGGKDACQVFELRAEGSVAPNRDIKMKEAGPEAENLDQGPLDLFFEEKKGWTAEVLGPTSKHWKRLARETNKHSSQASESPTIGKREGPTPL